MAERHLAPSTSSSDDDGSEAESWIEWFCKQEGNEFFCEIDPRYIDDNFNLYGLREIIGSNFRKCLDVILDRTDSDDNVDNAVQDLYGLIHARFVVTKRGQDKMKRKFRNCEFGVCPLLSCQQQPVLPVGLKDTLDAHSVMVYCPRCNQVMLPTMRAGEDEYLDGAYFGTTFPHLFLMQFPELRPPPPLKMVPYVPRVFGFKVRLPNPIAHVLSGNANNSNNIAATVAEAAAGRNRRWGDNRENALIEGQVDDFDLPDAEDEMQGAGVGEREEKSFEDDGDKGGAAGNVGAEGRNDGNEAKVTAMEGI